MSPLSSELKNKPSKKQREACSYCFLLHDVSYLSYPSTMKMEATYSSETSIDFQRITRRYVPVDRTLPQMICSNENCNDKRDLHTDTQTDGRDL
jgi:glyoxylate utilization-related uncharacterized protein